MSIDFVLDTEPRLVRGRCEICDGTGRDWQAPPPEGPFDPIEEHDRCDCCAGTGVAVERVYPLDPINMANATAHVVTTVLGLPTYGRIAPEAVPDAIRNAIRALHSDLGQYEEAPSYTPGGHAGVKVIERPDGVAEIVRMGPAIYNFGMAADGIAYRIERLLRMLHTAATLGCGVYWV